RFSRDWSSDVCSSDLQHNDYYNEDGTTKTNHSGGIQGGISNGMDIYFDVAFKPVATLLQPQEMLTAQGMLETIKGKGRHDACVEIGRASCRERRYVQS